ncbi:hypothetical protein [Streptococcus acidominimus]|uniref:Superfamily II DNA/RNA helicase n=1 Tax=Streptococcus acidominimus TaxID=1326 RepID=A0A1Q8EBA7_STRAI|nr:hypothetical protein [Streptococcus acidominimus]OLF49065.1 hypothetical protein BU200_09325 [Streptococcus acidominimus]SUN07101.1 superfamily II DNA/RNA helicase [Streptococcus acidominimus]
MKYATSSQLADQSIFDTVSYEKTFLRDLESVEKLILSISTAYHLTLQQLVGLVKEVSLEIYISKDDRNQTFVDQLSETGITVHAVAGSLPNVTLINDSIVWFGKLPLLIQHYDKEESMLLRIESENLFQEFREIIQEKE